MDSAGYWKKWLESVSLVCDYFVEGYRDPILMLSLFVSLAESSSFD